MTLHSPFIATSCVPVNREQDEWAAVEWFVQMTYRSSCVSVRSLWSVSNPALSHQFTRRAGGKHVFRCLALADELPVTVRQVCERGVQQSLRVAIGNQLLPGATTELNPLTGFAVRKRSTGRRIYEAVVFRVVVGFALSAVSDSPNPRDLPSDYDAYLIPTSAEDEPVLAAVENEAVVFLAPSAFRQTYLLKEGAQSLPEFVVQFEVDDDASEKFCLPPCANCERAAATVWCVADEAALCGHCDEVEHSAEDNKIAARHHRVAINERPSAETSADKCAIVPSETAAFWDASLGLVLSKKAVDEALVQSAGGPLLDIDAAYRSAVKTARREDTDIALLKKTLLAEVQTVSDELRAVAREKEEAELRINAVVDAATSRSAEIAKEKSASLLAAQERLSKQLEFVQWALTVLPRFAEQLAPAEWLRLWTNLNRLVKEKLTADLVGDEANEGAVGDPFVIHLQANLRVNSN